MDEYFDINVLSNCCNEPMFIDVDICPKCKEHCAPICYNKIGHEIPKEEYENLDYNDQSDRPE